MRGRFDVGLRAMRRSFRVRFPLALDPLQAKQYDLAGRIASRYSDWGTEPEKWQRCFNINLEEIQQQDREFEVSA